MALGSLKNGHHLHCGAIYFARQTFKWNFEFDFNDRPSSSHSAENLKQNGINSFFLANSPKKSNELLFETVFGGKGMKGCYN